MFCDLETKRNERHLLNHLLRFYEAYNDNNRNLIKKNDL